MKKLFFIGLFLLIGAVTAHAQSVTLTVTPGANAVSHTILKSTDGGAFTTLTTLTMPTLTYTDTAVALNHVYQYESVTNSSVNSSAPSAPCTSTLASAGPSTINCTINP